MTPFEQYVRLVDSPENQALPEAERLPMVAGWRHYDSVTVLYHEIDDYYGRIQPGWHKFIRNEGRFVAHYTAENPDPIDLQAASGVLAGWLGLRGVMTTYVKEFDYWASTYSTTTPAIAHAIDELDGYPTLLAAQVAAAGAVLGVKPK